MTNETTFVEVDVQNGANLPLDTSMLQGILDRAQSRYVGEAHRIEVYPDRPSRDGSLHWLMRVSYISGGGITVGVLQRKPGGEIEFHS